MPRGIISIRIVTATLFALIAALGASADDPAPALPSAPLSAPHEFSPPVLIKQVNARPPKFGRIGFRHLTIRACFVVTVEGETKDVTFVGAHDDEFESSVRHALIRWRFKPAARDGVPVEYPACADFEFRGIGG